MRVAKTTTNGAAKPNGATRKPKLTANVKEAFLRGDVVDAPLDSVQPNDWNPNEVSAQHLAAIRYGFKTVGWLRSNALTIWGTDEKGQRRNLIIDGEHRWEQAKKVGLTTGPMIFLDGITEREAKELTISLDNLRGKFQNKPLAALMSDLLKGADRTVATLKMGFSAKELEKFSRSGTAPIDRTYPESKKPTKPKTKPGDVIQLGSHRLICADSFDPETLPTLLGDKLGRVDMVMTDPPYAIYGSSTGLATDVADDRMIRPFFVQVFQKSIDAVKFFGHIYICCDFRSWASIWDSSKQGGAAPKNCIIWDKGGGGLGSSYAITYEMIGFFAKLPPRGAMKQTEEGGQRIVNRPNIVRFNRASGEDRTHNATKPVELMAEFIKNSSDEGETVLDLFGGSGSTLLAAEQLGRTCFMVEVDPGWCDVIVDRWEKFTGKSAKRIERAA